MRKSPSTIDNYSRDLEDFLQAVSEIPFSDVLEADETLIARYVDGLWSRPARRGSGHNASRDKITYVTGSKLSLNTIRRRISARSVSSSIGVSVSISGAPCSTLFPKVCVVKHNCIGYVPSAPWIPSESQFADLLLYVFARMSLRNQALILVLYDGALRREEVTFSGRIILMNEPIPSRSLMS